MKSERIHWREKKRFRKLTLKQELTGTTVALLLDLGKLAGNVSSVAIEDGRVPVHDLSGVVEDDDLGREVGGRSRGTVLGVTTDVATTKFFHRDVLGKNLNTYDQ